MFVSGSAVLCFGGVGTNNETKNVSISPPPTACGHTHTLTLSLTEHTRMFLAPTLPDKSVLLATAKPITAESREVACIIDGWSSGKGTLLFTIETTDGYVFERGGTYTVHVSECVSAACWHSPSLIPRAFVLEGVVGTTHCIHTRMHFESPAFSLRLYRCFIEKK